MRKNWRRPVPGTVAAAIVLRRLHELHFTGQVAVVAREKFDGGALKRPGVPTILYPMRNAVD